VDNNSQSIQESEERVWRTVAARLAVQWLDAGQCSLFEREVSVSARSAAEVGYRRGASRSFSGTPQRKRSITATAPLAYLDAGALLAPVG
jgi:hypothetical protein